MSNDQFPTSGRRRLTRKQVLLTIAVLTAVLACGLPVLHHVRNATAKDAVRQSLAAGRSENDKDLAGALARLSAAGIIGEQVVYSKTDVCSIGHVDGGWMVSSYYQTCDLVTIAGYLHGTQTPGLGDASSENQLIGPDSCYEQSSDGSHAWSALSCGIPSAEAAPYEVNKTKLLTTFGDWSEANKANIWVMARTNYYHEDLGCSHLPNFLFCNSPRPTPITAS